MILEFPSSYVTAIEDLIFPKWYAACFMSGYSNSAVWGHYGANHSGCCLIFNTEQNENYSALSLRDITSTGSGGNHYGMKPYELRQIDYSGGHGEIDFFRSIGNLPIFQLEDIWFKDPDGNVSECSQDIFTDEKKFRERYWKNFQRDIVIKTKDWGYENEYRLIMASMIFNRQDKENRLPSYEFSSLKGIIFGINTSTKDTIEILKIIQRKCKENGRDTFELYQAYYCNDDKIIKRARMTLVESSIGLKN